MVKYKNPYSNYILVFFQILSITQISLFVSFVGLIRSSIVFSDDENLYINDVQMNLNWKLIFYGLLFIQIAIACLLYYIAIRISRNKP
jgi:hypothetical protein